jgi:hypothetical protein
MASLTAQVAQADTTRSGVLANRAALNTVQRIGGLANPGLPGPDDGPPPSGESEPYFAFTGYVCRLEYKPLTGWGVQSAGRIDIFVRAEPFCQGAPLPDGYANICSASQGVGCPLNEDYHHPAFAMPMMFESLHRAMLAGQRINVYKLNEGGYTPTTSIEFSAFQ